MIKSWKNQKTISIILVLVMIILALPSYNVAGAEPSPHRHVFIEGYFEYWKGGDGIYRYQSYFGGVYELGSSDPEGQRVNIVFTPITIPSTHQLTALYAYKFDWDPRDDSKINEWQIWDTLQRINQYYAYDMRIFDVADYLGQSGTTIIPYVGLELRGTSTAQNMGNDVYRTYACFVAVFTDNAYIEDPEQWEIDHGLLDPPDDPDAPDPDPNCEAIAHIRASYVISLQQMDSVTANSEQGIKWFDAPLGVPVSLEGWARDLNDANIDNNIEQWYWNIGGTVYTTDNVAYKNPPSIIETQKVMYTVSLMVKYKGKWSEKAKVGLRFTEISPPARPPTTSIIVPEPVYPIEITSSGDYQNTIAWSYESPVDAPYKHSIVSIDRSIGDHEWETIISNKIQTDREFKFEGNAGQEYRIRVIVVDQNNQESSESSRSFEVINPYPDIELILDDSQEERLGITVENHLDEEIENIFNTIYTYWDIKNQNGEILISGEGKAPEWVDLDARFTTGAFTVTQYATNILNNEALDRKEFYKFAVLDFSIVPDVLYEGEYAQVIDKSKGADNKQWQIRRDEEDYYADLILNSNDKFTMREAGVYIVKLSGDGFFSLTSDTSSTTRSVEFLSTKPTADFNITGHTKMYKKISLDGSLSIDKTGPELQSKYPILFENPNTMFVVEPLADLNGEIDISRNDYVKGMGKEIIDGRVVFRGRQMQDIRIDKEGWYRIKYKVVNEMRESDYAEKNVYVQSELSPVVGVNIPNAIVYRDPNNLLKVVFDVVINYTSPDDKIDTDQSKLLVSYDYNGDGDFSNDGAHSGMWVTKNDENLSEYISIAARNFKEDRAEFTFVVDNEYKNLFGTFKFDFLAVEEPDPPNYIDENNGLEYIPSQTASTDCIDVNEKTVLVDNLRPIIDISTTREYTLELFIFEINGNKINVDVLMQQLKANRINAVIYVIDREGKVEIYKPDY
ncbi:MAG: hypothetical protein HPY66_2946 [Firmicutes bacterium]|nr:hypothetical protein [Bacillota bacterium]